MSKTHDLKIQPEPFRLLVKQLKLAEIRFDDRDFCAGDTLRLREWKPRKKAYTGRGAEAKISHITRLAHWIPGIDHRWCVLHLDPDSVSASHGARE